MTLLDVYWTSAVNVLVVLCACGRVLSARVDRWRVTCPSCGEQRHVDVVRGQRISA